MVLGEGCEVDFVGLRGYNCHYTFGVRVMTEGCEGWGLPYRLALLGSGLLNLSPLQEFLRPELRVRVQNRHLAHLLQRGLDVVVAWCQVSGSGLRVEGVGIKLEGSRFRLEGSG